MKPQSLFNVRLSILHVAGLIMLLAWLPAFGQGDLNPPGPPGPTMKTLQQVEPRTPVDAINTPGNSSYVYIINAPGSYYLTGNVEAFDSNGILISAPGVTLDLNGFEVSKASGTGGLGISITDSQCVVRNGQIIGFHTGIRTLNGARLRLKDLTVTNMTGDGIRAFTEAQIENCQVYAVEGIGIHAGIVSIVRNCTVRTTGSHGIQAAETSIIEGNILNNCLGDSIIADNRCTIRNNTCDFPTTSGAGIHLTSNQGESRVENNNIMRRAIGIQIDGPDNYVSGNTVRANVDNYVIAPRNHLNLLLSEIPETVDWPATVTLAGTLYYTSGVNGITVNSDDVTIDLNGHSLIGGPGSEHAILLPNPDFRSGITVRNGTIRNWGSDGIRAFNAFQSQFVNLHAISNGWSSGFGMGIRVGNECLVKNCTAYDNEDTGISAQLNSSLVDCQSGNNGTHGFSGSIGTVARGCTANFNREDGFNVFVGSSIQNCSANNNDGDGFDVDAGTTISDSAARNNEEAGIRMAQESTAQNCVASSNGDGIIAGIESTVRNCTAASNDNDGIEVSSNCLVTGNHCNGNGTSTTDGAGIRATGAENRIDDNHVAQNDRGILVIDSAVDRNFIVRNTARNNGGLNYVIPAGNRVGSISIPPISGAISGDSSANALGAGSTDPWTNFSY